MQGTELRDLRKAARMSQADMAEAIGMSRETIGQMERGQAPIEKRTALALRALVDRSNSRLTDSDLDEVAFWVRAVFAAHLSQQLDVGDTQGAIVEALDHAVRGREDLMRYIRTDLQKALTALVPALQPTGEE